MPQSPVSLSLDKKALLFIEQLSLGSDPVNCELRPSSYNILESVVIHRISYAIFLLQTAIKYDEPLIYTALLDFEAIKDKAVAPDKTGSLPSPFAASNAVVGHSVLSNNLSALTQLLRIQKVCDQLREPTDTSITINLLLHVIESNNMKMLSVLLAEVLKDRYCANYFISAVVLSTKSTIEDFKGLLESPEMKSLFFARGKIGEEVMRNLLSSLWDHGVQYFNAFIHTYPDLRKAYSGCIKYVKEKHQNKEVISLIRQLELSSPNSSSQSFQSFSHASSHFSSTASFHRSFDGASVVSDDHNGSLTYGQGRAMA